jgi:hypothetical protein
MAWMKLHDSVLASKKRRKLARDLGITKAQALGHIAALWLHATCQLKDGDLTTCDQYDIAEFAEWDGDPIVFLNALVDCKLVDYDEATGKKEIHNWLKYAGTYEATRRKREQREREKLKALYGDQVTQMSRDSHADVTQNDRDCQSIRGEEKREDKIRKEKKTKGESSFSDLIDYADTEQYICSQLQAPPPGHKQQAKILDLLPITALEASEAVKVCEERNKKTAAYWAGIINGKRQDKHAKPKKSRADEYAESLFAED